MGSARTGPSQAEDSDFDQSKKEMDDDDSHDRICSDESQTGYRTL